MEACIALPRRAALDRLRRTCLAVWLRLVRAEVRPAAGMLPYL